MCRRVRHYYAVRLQKPREIAFRVLRRRDAGVDFVENLLDVELSTARLTGPDRALVQELAYGVVRWQAALDWLIARRTGDRDQKPALRTLLRLGLYQIFWLDRVPDHAAVNETVDLARQAGFGPQAGFVNALLRGYAREKEATRRQLADLKSSDPAAGWSHPGWLVERWRQLTDAASLARLLEWNNTPPRTLARVNTLRSEAGKLLEQWRDENVDYDFGRWDWVPEGLVFELKSHPPLATLPSFRAGGFYVQDPSTLLAARVLDPQPGETVLDLCAAPGGKTTFLAQQMQNQGRIVAADNSPDRLTLLRENCARLGVTCVTAVAATGLAAGPAALFDRVLVDAPCSNTGALRRRVDLRWRLRPEEIGRLAAAQAALLDRAAASVRPGGVLVYSTCSLEPEENGGVVAGFLGRHAEFTVENRRTVTPFADGADGAFVARFRRAPAA